MMNLGFSRLRIVKPDCDYKGFEAKKMALKASFILDEAEIFENLHDALKDCQYALGTTRRFGKYKDDFLFPDQAASRLLSFSGDAIKAVVFGREDRGLHKDELDLCQHFITIPSVEAYPSMNLSHAVTLCLYELRKLIFDGKIEGINDFTPAENDKIEAMFSHMRKTLLDIEYLDPLSPDHILRTFRRIFGRAVLSERDVRILQGLWSRIDWVDSERKKAL
jgi:tRNA/rRNA methyltransferase